MKFELFEKQMRALEYFHDIYLLPDTWVIIRLDGRGFSKFTEKKFEKPFDKSFHNIMVNTSKTVLEELQGIYVCTHSDEMSILLLPEWELFNRRLEKVLSLSSSIASAYFTKEFGEIAHFDSRVWISAKKNQVIDYFRWRQSDSERCAINIWCYWTLRKNGLNYKRATKAIEGKSLEFKKELLLRNNINFKEIPLWHRRGSALFYENYQKESFNPQKNEKVFVTRRRIAADEELPDKEDYSKLIIDVIDSYETNKKK